MAIVIEEEKNKSGLITAIIWIIVLAIIVAAIYYLFFSQPQLIEVVVPTNLQNAQNISKININPDLLNSNPVFNQLKPYNIQSTSSGTNIGRSNPFLSY